MGFKQNEPLSAARDRHKSNVQRTPRHIISIETIIKNITSTFLLRFVWAPHIIPTHLSI